MSRDSLPYYNTHARELSPRYESLGFESVQGWLLPFLPESGGTALDIGAGSGRDARGLSALGFEVVAVEPSAGMRAEGEHHPSDQRIHWVNDALPGLDSLMRQSLSFDLVLVSAVWMHILPRDRPRALRKLLSLLKPSGLLAVTLRHGPPDPERAMHDTSPGDFERMARALAAEIVHVSQAPDLLGRTGISWTRVLLRIPDDGTGALPLLRHQILVADKSATYKLGLLRTVARIADSHPGMARNEGEEAVSIPLGLVGLVWIRLYKPLLEAGLPQSPANHGTEGLGFIGESWRMITPLSPLDLRPGMRFPPLKARPLHRAIQDALRTIVRMPAHYMTYPGGSDPLFRAVSKRNSIPPEGILLDEAYFQSFGEMIIPLSLWRALSRFDAWIEPALVNEWIHLMEGYAKGQGRALDPGKVARAMVWTTPARDVALIRKIARPILERKQLFCIWSGKRLSEKSFEVDHCFPWAAWPCDDLWNLLPADRVVNLRKSDRLPSLRTLNAASERLSGWWIKAYLSNENRQIGERFLVEARGTLPLSSPDPPSSPDLGEILEGMLVKRMTLHSDQGIEEWESPGSWDPVQDP